MWVTVLVFDRTVTVSFACHLEPLVSVSAKETLAELATVWRQNEAGFSACQLVQKVGNRFPAWDEVVCVCWFAGNPAFQEFLVAGSLIHLGAVYASRVASGDESHPSVGRHQGWLDDLLCELADTHVFSDEFFKDHQLATGRNLSDDAGRGESKVPAEVDRQPTIGFDLVFGNVDSVVVLRKDWLAVSGCSVLAEDEDFDPVVRLAFDHLQVVVVPLGKD